MNRKIRLMLVEDHAGYRETIAIALEQKDNMELIGQFGTAEIALRTLQGATENNLPDIILLDINLPGFSGLEALPWILQYAPKAKTIVLTQSDNAANVKHAISQGAAGYLLKSATLAQITEGIEAVMDGGASLDPEVAMYILNSLRNTTTQDELDKSLSERELETLKLIGQGLAKKEIADRLGISITTVAYHVKHVYEKLNVPNAPAAIDRAHRLGIFSQDKKPN
ncbi:MAG: response regulator [Akkermansiaceae bacterium]